MTKKKIIGRHNKVMDLTYGKRYNPRMKLNAADAGAFFDNFNGVLNTVTPMVQGFAANAEIKKKEDLESELNRRAQATMNGANTLDALQAAREAYAPLPTATEKDMLVSNKERWSNTIGSAIGGAAAGSKFGWIGAGLGLLGGAAASEIGYGIGKNRAEKRLTQLKNLRDAADERLDAAFDYQLGNIYDNNYNRLMANYSASGGLLGGNGHNTGGGNTSVPTIFTHGGIFSNGMELIDAGGSHEENPNGGVTVSYDDQGVPNLVEQGEVIFNDYVYSNRFAPGGDLLKKYHMPRSWEKYTFARIAEKLGEESRERPADSISKRGLEVSMDALSNMQEEYKESERQKEIAKAIKRMTPEEKAAMFDAASQQIQEQYGTPEEMYNAQMPEGPAFLPQEYAEGGNIFDAGNKINRALRRQNAAAVRIATEEADAISAEQSAANKARAEQLAYILAQELGIQSPTKALIRNITDNLTGARMVNTGSYSGSVNAPMGEKIYGEPTMESFQNLARQLGARGNGSEEYTRFASLFNNGALQQRVDITSLPELDAERAAAIEAAFNAGAGNNPFAGLNIEPPAGGRGGGRGSSSSAGSATKSAETKSGGLENPDEVTKRYMMEQGIVSPSAGRTLTGAMTAEYNNALVSRAGLTPEAKTAFAKKARGRGVGSDRQAPVDNDRGLFTGTRYASAVADTIGALQSYLTPPDYTHANEIRNAGIPYEAVDFQPVDSYMTYRPVDRNATINALRNQSLGTAAQLMNASGNNPGAAAAGLLGLNYGTNQAIGQGLVQQHLANNQLEQSVLGYNRQTDQYNSEGKFKQSVYNRDRFQPLVQPRILGAQLAAQEDNLTAQARSANTTAAADAWTAIGNENAWMNMVKNDPTLLYQYDYNPFRFGTMAYKPAKCGGNLKSRKKRK